MNLLAVLFFLATQQQLSQTIIVTASEIPETVESTPASVTVITKKDIDDRAARDITDVLREVPGLAVSRTGSLGKTTSIFVRGASSKQVLVLWNGVEINDPYFSGYNFGQFSTVGVQRIEVARGPFSSLYGADAVGGVVNIITTGGQNRTEADISAGGRGLMNGAVSMEQSAGNATYSVAAEHRQDNGFALNDNDRRNSILGSFAFAPWNGFSIGLTGRAANYDLGVPRNTNTDATAYVSTPHHRENGNEWQLALPVTAELGSVHTELRLSQNRRDDRNEDPDVQSFGATQSTRSNIHLSARESTVIGTVVVGAEAERATATNHDSFGLDLDTHHRSSDALFVEDRYSRGGLELSAGARVDHYSTFGSETSPRVAAGWSRNGNKFHAAYGESFRAPQIGELYLPFFGNPDLRAERSRSAEAGYDRFFADGGTMSITAFQNTFRDLITYDLVSNRFENIGLARSHGVELSASDRRGPWNASLSYTFLHAVDSSTGDPLVRRPKHSGSIAVGYTRGAGSAELVASRVGSRPDVNDLFPFDTVTNRAYNVADLTLRWSLRAVTPYVKIENLTNTRYQEVFGYPSPARRAIAGIRYSR